MKTYWFEKYYFCRRLFVGYSCMTSDKKTPKNKNQHTYDPNPQTQNNNNRSNNTRLNKFNNQNNNTRRSNNQNIKKIDINTAGIDEIKNLSGMGLISAKKIIQLREMEIMLNNEVI